VQFELLMKGDVKTYLIKFESFIKAHKIKK